MFSDELLRHDAELDAESPLPRQTTPRPGCLDAVLRLAFAMSGGGDLEDPDGMFNFRLVDVLRAARRVEETPPAEVAEAGATPVDDATDADDSDTASIDALLASVDDPWLAPFGLVLEDEAGDGALEDDADASALAGDSAASAPQSDAPAAGGGAMSPHGFVERLNDGAGRRWRDAARADVAERLLMHELYTAVVDEVPDEARLAALQADAPGEWELDAGTA